VIAELSEGSAEMNKLFLALASAATKPASLGSDNEDSLGDDDDDGLGDGGSGRKANRFSRTKRSYGTTSATNVRIDDLLGSRTTAAGADPTTSEENRSNEGASFQQRKDRLFNFIKRHRRASAGTAKEMRFTMSEEDGPKRRPGRANRCVNFVRVCRISPWSVLTQVACGTHASTPL
jgi:hypothetical protein